jgi:hypothetical protein
MPPRNILLVQSSESRSYGDGIENTFLESSMQEEYNSLLKDQTWDLVPLPSGTKLVKCIWVYRNKITIDV